jgi:hypothetical protein
MEEEKKEKAFVVRDKRLFDESGQPRTEETPKAEAVPAAEKVKTEEAPLPEAGEQSRPAVQEEPPSPEAEGLPEVNFYNFILSLSSTAMYHFGDFSDPSTRKSQRNLAAAKQTIDLLTMLLEKTKGNLDQDEKNLLEGILYELRIRYVKEMADG